MLEDFLVSLVLVRLREIPCRRSAVRERNASVVLLVVIGGGLCEAFKWLERLLEVDLFQSRALSTKEAGNRGFARLLPGYCRVRSRARGSAVVASRLEGVGGGIGLELVGTDIEAE